MLLALALMAGAVTRLRMVVTAYCPGKCCCGPKASGKTSLGLRVRHGYVAVDPRVIPFWMRLFIPGYGPALAVDRGGAIKGNRMDVFFPTHKAALAWGRRTVYVSVLGIDYAARGRHGRTTRK